jgi:hypothetical protein
MSITPRSAVTAAAFVAAGALGATLLTGVAGAVGAAPAADPSPSVSSSSPAAQAPGRGGLLRSLLHGQLTVADGDGTAVVDVQRGEVVAASDTSVTVRSSDGYEQTYAIDGDTVVRRDRSDVDGSALRKGDTAMVRAQSGTADVVRALSPEALQKLKDRAANGGGMMGRRGGMAGMGLGTDRTDADDAGTGMGMGAGMMSGL